MVQETEIDGFKEEFLEISPNILSSFPKFRPPVSLYRFDTEINDTKLLIKAGDRMGKELQQLVTDMCDQGLLFLAARDYRTFAEHISKHLGLILTEDKLSTKDIMGIIFNALKARFENFVDQPVDAQMDLMKKDLAIFCEYMWADSDRVNVLKDALEKEYSLAIHAINSCFIGTALYMLYYSDDVAKLKEMIDPVMGFMLHDLGMFNIPPYVVHNSRPLLNQEKTRVREHTEIGTKMLGRINGLSEPVMECVSQHHERINGKGYPKGVKDDKMSAVSKICAVADSYAAMVTDRIYAKAFTPKQAVVAMAKTSGYDKEIMEILVRYVVA